MRLGCVFNGDDVIGERGSPRIVMIPKPGDDLEAAVLLVIVEPIDNALNSHSAHALVHDIVLTNPPALRCTILIATAPGE